MNNLKIEFVENKNISKLYNMGDNEFYLTREKSWYNPFLLISKKYVYEINCIYFYKNDKIVLCSKWIDSKIENNNIIYESNNIIKENNALYFNSGITRTTKLDFTKNRCFIVKHKEQYSTDIRYDLFIPYFDNMFNIRYEKNGNISIEKYYILKNCQLGFRNTEKLLTDTENELYCQYGDNLHNALDFCKNNDKKQLLLDSIEILEKILAQKEKVKNYTVEDYLNGVEI